MANMIGPLSVRFDVRLTAALYLGAHCSWLKVRDYFRFLALNYSGVPEGTVFLDADTSEGVSFELVTSKGLTLRKGDKLSAPTESQLKRMVLIIAEQERLAVVEVLRRRAISICFPH